ncbi:ABC transporter G family member 20-like [Brevipalpus obovatus]|uniref:ABC transporter G family member 20-like n=1 Tax=Brevipalpus obovatus TaxID=246614 RepID=UPI003D9EADDD
MISNDSSEKSRKVVLEIRNVSFRYNNDVKKSTPILNNIHLKTYASEICAIVGPSGCGKTTLIKLAITLLPLKDGSVKLFGKNFDDPSIGIPGPNVGYMPQEDALPSDLRVRDSLYFFGLLNNMSLSDLRRRIDQVLDQIDLQSDSEKFIFQLSGGMKRRLSLAISLLHSPQLLILDEPTVGCDPVLRSQIWTVLRQMSVHNRTSIVITTHYIEECRQADTINFMRGGKFILQTKPEKLSSIVGTSNIDEAFLRLCSSSSMMNRDAESNPGQNLEKPSRLLYEKVQTSKNVHLSHLKIIIILILRYVHAFVFDFTSIQTVLVLPTIISIMVHVCLSPRILGSPIGVVIENQTVSYDGSLLDQLNVTPKCPECLHPSHFVDYVNHEVFQVIAYRDLDTALDDVRRYKINGVVHIGALFTEYFISRVTSHWTSVQEAAAKETIIKFYGDASKTFTFRASESYLLDAYLKYWESSRVHLGLKNTSLFPFEYQDPIIGQAKDGTVDKSYFTELGYIMSNGVSGAIAVAGFGLLNELRDETMKRCLPIGIRCFHLFIAQLIVNGFFLGLSIVATMFSAIHLLDLPLRSSIFSAALLLILQVCIGIVFGQLNATVLRSEIAIILTLFLSYSYTAGPCGCLFPLETQPYYMRTFANFLPQTIPMIAIRDALIRGSTIMSPVVIKGLAISFGYLIFLVLITLKVLNKQLLY